MQTQPIVTDTEVFFYCDKVSDYFRILEDDSEAWTVAPEYEWLAPMVVCNIVRLAGAAILPGCRELEDLESSS